MDDKRLNELSEEEIELTKEELECYRKAGKMAAQALKFGKGLIKPGAKLLEVTEKVEKFIEDKGGELAFPVNISMNEIAAHYAAKKDDDFEFKNELVKLDVGVHINGYVGDNACSIDLSGKYQNLIDASREALEQAIAIVKPGVEIWEIGKVIEDVIIEKGFQPVKNLSGHGLGRYLTHAWPTIPNYENTDATKLQENMVIAIEPFATNGTGLVKNSKNAEIFNMIEFRPMRVGFVRNIMKYIQTKFKTLPFSKRDLFKKFSEAQVNYTLKKLREIETVTEYSPLNEINGGMVTQSENTLLVTKDGCEILTKV